MEYCKLCEDVEREAGRKMSAPSDFKWLADRIEKRTHERVSESSLMRIWGYVKSNSTPRIATLSVLTRYIGYLGWDDYVAHQSEHESAGSVANSVMKGSVQDQNTHSVSGSTGRRGRKIWIAVVTGIALVVILAFGWNFSVSRKIFGSEKSQSTPTYITTIDKLSNYRQYYIHTRDKKRGTMGINSHQLASTYDKAQFYRCDTASTFALIKYEGSYYLYNVGQNRFINVLLAETEDPLRQEYIEKNWCAIDIHPEEGHLVMDFWANKAEGKVLTLNVNAGNGIIITDCGTMNGIYDDGNLFCLEDAGPFDPTVALDMLKRSQAKNGTI